MRTMLTVILASSTIELLKAIIVKAFKTPHCLQAQLVNWMLSYTSMMTAGRQLDCNWPLTIDLLLQSPHQNQQRSSILHSMTIPIWSLRRRMQNYLMVTWTKLSRGRILCARLALLWPLPVLREAGALIAPELTLKCPEWPESRELKKRKNLPALEKEADLKAWQAWWKASLISFAVLIQARIFKWKTDLRR